MSAIVVSGRGSFQEEFFRGNRAEVCRRLADGAGEGCCGLLIAGGKQRFRYDTDVQDVFRQESNFWYLTGVDYPGCLLWIPMEAPSQCILFVPESPTSMIHEVYDGAVPPHEYFADLSGIERIKPIGEFPSLLSSLKSPTLGTVWTTSACRDELPEEADDVLATPSEDQELQSVLQRMRHCKLPCEIDEMRVVNRISSNAHEDLMRNLRPGVFEYQLESVFRHSCMMQGCKEMAYPPIVGSGINASVLHYMDNRKLVAPGELVLVDAGAERIMYAADITRTSPASGKFSREQRDIYSLVQKAQETVISQLTFGSDMNEQGDVASDIIMEGLHELGILRGALSDLRSSNVISHFLPHMLGHFLGLNVHDEPGFPGPLEQGHTFTVEPGCYFYPGLLNQLHGVRFDGLVDFSVLERYSNVGGIRLEDNLVLGRDGVENLTTAAKQLDEVEALVGSSVR